MKTENTINNTGFASTIAGSRLPLSILNQKLNTMLKSTVKLLPFLFLVLFAANSCKKKNDQKSKTQLLTQKPWVVSNYEEKSGSGNYQSFYAAFDACEKDDRFTFFANNTVEYDPLVSCIGEQKETGSWAFTDNETKITFGLGSYTLEQLTDNVLVLTDSYVDQGVTITERYTFSHP